MKASGQTTNEASARKMIADKTVDRRGRRKAIRSLYTNAGIWAVGNGLVSSTLIVYLALSVGARSFQSGMIYAAPSLAGTLRLLVPVVLSRLGHRKAVCLTMYGASALVLSLVPSAALALPTGSQAPVALVAAWCVYHLFEYGGTIALWSWTGDLVPRPIFGRFCGYRQRWLVSGRIAGIAFSIALATVWSRISPGSSTVHALAVSAACGAVFMLAAVVPLWFVPGVEYLPSAVPRTPWRTLVRAMSRQPYRQLVLFNCVFAFVNGITQAAQGTFPPRVLKIPYQGLQTIVATMWAGQMLVAPTAGRWCDSFGSRPIMIVSQLVVATGPLFLFFATFGQWWWLLAAYAAWIAYAGLNVGLDNIKLQLAPQDNNAPYLATYYSASDLVYGSSILLAGWIFDRLEDRGFEMLSIYAGTFLVGWIGRTLVAALLAPIEEPGAWSVGAMLRSLLRGDQGGAKSS